jgi:YfiH family protein
LLRQDTKGLVTYQFEGLDVEGLAHAVFTRLGGVSRGPFATLNVGRSVGDDEAAVAENHARVYAHLGLEAGRIATPRQVHGNRVAIISDRDAGQVMPNTDGLVTDVPGIALLLRFADCQPILLYDVAHHALGLIHAGWRGVAQGIAIRAVEAMQEGFNSRPRDLVAGLGPAIGPCCYTVGHNVAAAMGYALPHWQGAMQKDGDRWRLDLSAANAQQLTKAGVRTIEEAHLCTACHSDEFFSHRAGNGHTGRFAVVAYLKPHDTHPRDRAIETPKGEPEELEPPFPDSLHPPGFPAFQESRSGNP